MDNNFASALMRMIFWRLVIACFVGAAVGIGGFLFVRWLIHYVAIHWK